VTPRRATPRRHPASRSWLDRRRHELFADPPTGSGLVFWTKRVIRLAWRWRDLDLGPILAVVAWIRFGISPVAFVAIAAPVSFVGYRMFTTADKDREAHRFKRAIQRAWLDMNTENKTTLPIPAIGRPNVKPHSTSAWLDLVEGTSERKLGRELADKAGVILRAKVSWDPDHEGGGLLTVRHGDTLKDEPDLPVHLGNSAGPELLPSWKALPIGVNRDGEPFTVQVFQQHFLMPGMTGGGKSTSQEAMGCSCLAAPHVDPWFADPQDVSLAAFRDAGPYAGSAADALVLLEQFHAAMRHRETEMAAAGTSLATPSARWRLQVMFIDELARLLDPALDPPKGKGELGQADRFKALLIDILNTGRKCGFVIVATCTNPRSAVLSDGLRDQFTTTICFRTRDVNASKVAVGAGNVAKGHEPHKLPAGERNAGRCIVFQGHRIDHIRTYRLWDKAAVRVVENLTAKWPTPDPETAVMAATGPDPTPTGEINLQPTKSETTSRPRRRGEARSIIVRDLAEHGPSTVQEVCERTGLSVSTTSRWMLGQGDCSDPIPVRKLPRNRYELIGGGR
jgi:hypothetical protein